MSSETRVRFKDKTLVDSILLSAVDQYQLRARRRNLLILAVVVAAIVVWRVWLS
jgi:hypothetical protein